jgi:hypothetical protein
VPVDCFKFYSEFRLMMRQEGTGDVPLAIELFAFCISAAPFSLLSAIW